MDVLKTAEFDRWFSKLKDRVARASIAARIRRIGLHGQLLGDFKPAGDGVFELRFDMGPGYRVYLIRESGRLILLLLGGGKGSQSRDILAAREMARDWRASHGC